MEYPKVQPLSLFYSLFISNLKVTLFADDAILTCINKNPNILENRTNAELRKVEDWIKTNKLKINCKKKIT